MMATYGGKVKVGKVRCLFQPPPLGSFFILLMSIFTSHNQKRHPARSKSFFLFLDKKDQMEIIIQETDQDILEILKYALEQEGYQVYALLDSTADFIGLIEQHRPHVVMLDFRLDGKICLTILERIKDIYPHLPVIAMSCNHNINNEYSAFGFDDYIPKPFDLDHLYLTLRKYIPKNISKEVVIEVLKKATSV
ncbi:DNA-binding NtrC family response regulator [Mucilaginibacter lappiensis]|uniref:DNA-binding NtrC family response regulator n=1 Tax=Mucilaginibacter lappiensis TaxID=354630 RepID=A0ABR6PD62_9SPHI|nr:response regulator [Mucilaginibacter lappiensis]MBB6107695.1 DNA-binding NtrC family response regulator [Mucilaginibacter lappiensis]